ncbi:MAG: hypothetical protein KatS3mg125_1552 [Lysobacterales bacterium]|jgi:hypothetical protein|nr:MAG: hypothetical protein KatS3mg125_1552 [Xanthomonadales bacterium]
MNGADNTLCRSFEMPAVSAESRPEKPSASPVGNDARRKPRPDAAEATREIGGPPGPEPTRYGDWERKGRCIDF